MKRWLPKWRVRGGEIADAMSSVLLGLALCSTLVIFVVYRLSARDWWPQVHGLSEDGTQYLSVCEAGLRVHDVASGKEVDRLTLRGPWAHWFAPAPVGYEPFHPLEYAAPEGCGFADARDDSELCTPYARSRVLISPSGRYIAAVFPAGYVMLWDRQSDRFQIAAEPHYCFEQGSFDESRGVFFVEAVNRPREQVDFPPYEDHSASETAAGESSSVSIVAFRLDDFEKVSAEEVACAGRRLNDDRNRRCIVDPEANEFRVMECDDFPFGSQRVVHRVGRKEYPFSLTGFQSVGHRSEAGKTFVASWSNVEIEFVSRDRDQLRTRQLRLPEALENETFRWFADGCVTLHNDDGYRVATWDEDKSVAVYEVPHWTFSEGVRLRSETDTRHVRLASLEGHVLDLPIGVPGTVIKRQMDLTAHPHLAFIMSCIVGGCGFAWCGCAAMTRRLFSHRGWMIAGLLMFWPCSFWIIERLLIQTPYGFLAYFAVCSVFGGLALLSGLGSLASRASFRAVVVCGCSLFALLVLAETVSRFESQRTQSGGCGCMGFGCYGS